MLRNINYYMLEASRIEVNFFRKTTVDFVLDLVDLLYQGYSDKGVSRIKNKILDSFGRAFNTAWYIQQGDVAIMIYSEYTFRHSLSGVKLVNSQNNNFLHSLYEKMAFSTVHYNLAFLLFLLGLVDRDDYLRWNTNVESITSVIGFSDSTYMNEVLYRSSDPVDEGKYLLYLNERGYCNLLSSYIRNASNYHTDYGYNVYDFIYNMLKGRKAISWQVILQKKDYRRIIRAFNLTGISNYDIFVISPSEIPKYAEEIAVVLPLITNYVDKRWQLCVVNEIIKKANPNLQDLIFNNFDIIKSLERGTYHVK